MWACLRAVHLEVLMMFRAVSLRAVKVDVAVVRTWGRVVQVAVIYRDKGMALHGDKVRMD